MALSLKLKPMTYYKKTTNKLFFNKYVNKVSVRNPLARFFRGNRLESISLGIAGIKEQFTDPHQTSVQIGSRWTYKSHARLTDVIVAEELITVLQSLSSYTLRVESNSLGLYSNDADFVDKVLGISNIHIEETSQAANDKTKEFLLKTPKAIIRKEYTHKYKVTINALWEDASPFLMWANKLPKIKTTGNDYKFGGYFYVTDDKTLSLCRIFLGNKLRKVEELVTSEEI